MAAVYKSLAKRQARAEEDDFEMMDEEFTDDTDDTSESEEEDEPQNALAGKSNAQAGPFMPKTRVLMLTSRGVTHRYVMRLTMKGRKHANSPFLDPDIAISFPILPLSCRIRIKKRSSIRRRRPLATTTSSTPSPISTLAM